MTLGRSIGSALAHPTSDIVTPAHFKLFSQKATGGRGGAGVGPASTVSAISSPVNACWCLTALGSAIKAPAVQVENRSEWGQEGNLVTLVASFGPSIASIVKESRQTKSHRVA